MNSSVDNNIIGELLISLKANITRGDNNYEYDDIADLFTSHYSNFRSILYQDELMPMFICLKNASNKTSSFPLVLLETFNKVAINLEFSSEIVEQGDSYTNHSANWKLSFDLLNDASGLIIKRRCFLEKEQIFIIEIAKQILVPDYYLNTKLLLKVELISTISKALPYVNHNNKLSVIDQLSLIGDKEDHSLNNHHNSIEKTLFKEIRIIRPMFISISKQINISINHSFIQIVLENITSSVNYADNSLKESAFIKQKGLSVKYITQGFPILINEIDFKKKQTRELFSLLSPQSLFKLIDTVHIEARDKFPIIIHPGEIYNLTIDIYTNDLAYNALSSQEGLFYSDNYITTSEKQGNETTYSLLSVISKFTSYEAIESQSDDIIKEHTQFELETPIFLYLACNHLLYKSISVSDSIKWSYQYKDMISLSMKWPDMQIVSNQFFELTIGIRNISHEVIHINIEMSDSYEEFKVNSLSNEGLKRECNDYFPDSLPEFKQYEVGVIKPLEEKAAIVSVMPMKSRNVTLPEFTIVNKLSNSKYCLTHKERIGVK